MQDRIETILEGALPEGIEERVRDNFNAAFGPQLSALGDFRDPAWSLEFIEKLSSVSDEESLREFEGFLGRAIFVAETEGGLIDEDGCYMYLELARMLAGAYGPGQFDKYFPGLKDMEGGGQAVAAYLRARLLEINQAMVETHGSLGTEKDRIESTYVLEDNEWLARKKDRDEAGKLEGELRQAFSIPQGGEHEALQPIVVRFEENRRRSEAAKQVKIEAYHPKIVLGQKLYRAIKDGNHAEAERLIEAGADFSVVVNEEFTKNNLLYKNETALTLAIGLDNVDPAFKMIGLCGIRDKARLDAKNGYGWTPLIIAAAHGHTMVVEALTKAGADLNVKGKYRFSALIAAAYHGHTATVEALIKAGADLNVKGKFGLSALIVAAERGHTATVEALIKAGADLNVKTEKGTTALILAALNGHTAIAEALIKAGADINAKDKDGDTELIIAARHGHTAIAEALIKAGADLNVKGKDGDTELIIAARHGHAAIAEALIKAGADINVKGTFNKPALYFAIINYNIDAAILLLEAGADPFIDPASYETIPQLEQFRENYLATIINIHGVEDLPRLACSANNSETSVKLFLKYAAENGRADLIYQAMARYKEIPENLKNALRDVEIAKAVVQCVAQDTVNDKTNNLFVLKSIAQANDGETYTLDDFFEITYGNLFWDTFKDALVNAIKTTKEKSAIIAKLDKDLNKGSLAELVKQVKDLKEDKAFLSRFGLGKQELLNELLKKSVEVSDYKSITSLLSQGANPNLTLGSSQSLLEAIWSKYNSMQVAHGLHLEEDPDFKPVRSILLAMLTAKTTNINIRSLRGQSILHAAASQGSASDIALLILRGANPNALDNMGKKPRFYAGKDPDKLRVLGMTTEQILADKEIMKQIMKDDKIMKGFSIKKLIYIIKTTGVKPSELIRYEENLVAIKKTIDEEATQPPAPGATGILDPTERAAPPASDGYSEDLARLMDKIGYDRTKAPIAYATTHSGGGEKFGYKLSEANKRSVELHSIRRHIDKGAQDPGSFTEQTAAAKEELNKLHKKYSIPIMR